MKSHITSLILCAMGIAAVAFFFISRQHHQTPSARFTIGILQTASHPALDAAREGFVTELKNVLGSDVAFVVRIAQGSVSQAHAIAQRFHADASISAILAIATPAAQAAAAVEKDKPIIITAVTDPHALGIMDPQRNVCGATDMIDVSAEIEALHQLIPHAQTIAILANNAEPNAALLAKMMVKEIETRNLKALPISVQTEADMLPAFASALHNADAIIAPTDNTVACAITTLAAQARAARKPFIVSDNLLVSKGALMARGVDYFESGRQAATCAQEVLMHGKKPHDIPLQSPKKSTIFVNKTVAQELGIIIPPALAHDVVWVENR